MKFYSLVVVLAVCACGDNADKNGGASEQTIGAAGGTLSSSDGAVALTLPAGALTEDVQLTLTKTSDAQGAIAGTSYALTAPTTTLATPAEIVFTTADLAGQDPSAVVVFSPDLTLTPEASDGSSVRATITNLANGTVAIADKNNVTTQPPPPPPPPPAASYFVDIVNGDDSHDGSSEATAFKTVCQAQTVVASGQTIGLMDGTYTPLNNTCTLSFANPVNLQAVNSGAVNWNTRATLASGGSVDGFLVGNENGAVGGFDITGGTTTITNMTFGDIKTTFQAAKPVLALTASAAVTFYGSGVNAFTVNTPNSYGYQLASLVGGVQLTVNAGIYTDSDPGNADFSCVPLFALSGSPAPSLTLSGVAIAHKGTIVAASSGSVTANDTSTLANQAHQPQGECASALLLQGTTTLSLADTTVQGGYYGVSSQGTLNATLTRATISGTAGAGVTLAGQTTFSARSSTFTGNVTGLDVVVNPTSTIDLGSNATAGNNTFSGNTSTGVRLVWEPTPASATAVSAVGNIWNPGVQAADPMTGTYAAGTLVTGHASGTNYMLNAATDELQF